MATINPADVTYLRDRLRLATTAAEQAMTAYERASARLPSDPGQRLVAKRDSPTFIKARDDLDIALKRVMLYHAALGGESAALAMLAYIQ